MLKELDPLVDQLQMVRRNLWEAVEKLSIEQLVQKMPGGEWSIKDALAHLSANEALMSDVLESIANGTEPPASGYDTDSINAEQVAEAESKTVAQVWQDLDESRRQLSIFLQRLTPEQIERRGSHPVQGMLNVREFLVLIYSHEATHGREIIEWTRRLKKTSDAA